MQEQSSAAPALIVFGRDGRGDEHMAYKDEAERHEAHYLCGCNPDYLGDDEHSAWHHWRFDGNG